MPQVIWRGYQALRLKHHWLQIAHGRDIINHYSEAVCVLSRHYSLWHGANMLHALTL